jgi:hypothetical protein
MSFAATTTSAAVAPVVPTGRRALTHEEYVGIHHMTALPESIRKFKAREYSVSALEQQMQVGLVWFGQMKHDHLHHCQLHLFIVCYCL